MSAPTRAAPGSRSPLLFIFLTVFIDLLGFGIVLPLLPIYSGMYGASGKTLGLLFGCFSGMQFLFAPLWGRLSDRIGRRPVLIGGLVGTAASYALFAYADSLPLLFASRLLAGIFGANVSTAAAYIADVTKPADRARGMGLIGAAFGLGFTLGPWFGGEMSHVSVHLPGLAACGLSLSAAIFGYWKLPEPARSDRTASRLFSFVQLRHAFQDPRIGVVLVLGFLAIFAFSAFETMFVVFGLAKFPQYFGMSHAVAHATLQEKLDAARYTGRYLFAVGLISTIIQGGLIRRLVPRFGETRLVVAGPAFLALGLLIIGLATRVPGPPAAQWATVIFGCVVMPFGFAINNPSLASLLSRASPPEQQGAYMGMNQSFASLARLTGPLLAGYLFDVAGAESPFLASAALLAFAALLAARYRAQYGATFATEAQAPA
jgi:MFS family permease